MNDNVIFTTAEEGWELIHDPAVRTYNIYIYHPGGDWVYNWGEIFCDSDPSYDMFRDLLEEDDIESHLESLEHDCSGCTPTPSEFVHALTFPECIRFDPVDPNAYEKWLELQKSEMVQSND